MPVLTVIYVRSHTLGGLLIRHHEPFGKWSHCGLVTDIGTVIEARAFHGVVETESDDFMARYPDAQQRCAIDVPCPDPLAGIDFARRQLGKGYDYGAVLGVLMRESWAEPDRWHCAELMEAAIAEAGRQRFRDAPWHITPNLSWMTE